MSRSFRTRISALGAGAALLPVIAQAHPGHAHATLVQGLLHPLTGWDHLVVLVSLGVLAAGRGTRVRMACGALLVVALGGGAALGLAWPAAPFVEPAILLSVVACVALLATRRQIGPGMLLTLSLSFAFIHGIAHGQEAPAGDLAAYFSGFALAGVVLYGAGLYVGRQLAQKGAPITSRQPGKSPASR